MQNKHSIKALSTVIFLMLMFAVPIASAQAQQEVFFAVINGGQENPPTTSSAVGNAVVTLDTTTNMLTYAIGFTPLDGTETVAHFHAAAEIGVNAGVLFDITGGIGPSPVGSPKNGTVGPLDVQNLRDLRDGLFYINIHSDLFPNGEIRGQVLAVGSAAANQIEAFVTRFYTIVLGRNPDQGGFDFWVNGLIDGSQTGGDIVRSFFLSPEYTALNDLDEFFIAKCYVALFNRAPAQAAFDFWVNQLNAGISRAEVLEGFIGSSEFAALASSFGITDN